jgi:hypothetical protein
MSAAMARRQAHPESKAYPKQNANSRFKCDDGKMKDG